MWDDRTVFMTLQFRRGIWDDRGCLWTYVEGFVTLQKGYRNTRKVFMTLQAGYMGNRGVFMTYLQEFVTLQKRYMGQ